MKVSIVLPTVAGREESLKRALLGYLSRTPQDVELEFLLFTDEPTCGIAWQKGAEIATGEYLHFSADDIVPGEGWLLPFLEVVQAGAVPVGLVVTATPEVLGEDQMPLPGNPLSQLSSFFEGNRGPDVVPDGYEARGMSEYPSVPFCSMEQWQRIGPMVASHYGTDKWFGYRAKQAGFPNRVRDGACFYHYAALAGRAPKEPGWYHLDRINFDLNVAFDAYVNGTLNPVERHPADGTPEGLRMARDWYRAHVQGGHPYWEDAP